MLDRALPFYNIIMRCDNPQAAVPVLPTGYHFKMYCSGDEKEWARLEYEIGDFDSLEEAKRYFLSTYCVQSKLDIYERCVFVVNDDGNIVGSCIAWHDLKGKDFVASLHWLIVSPKYQGNGIGKALCQKIMQIFCQNNEFPVYIHTQPWSYRAILLYMKQGFRLQSVDTFAHYENQFQQAKRVLKDILPESDYHRLIQRTDV